MTDAHTIALEIIERYGATDGFNAEVALANAFLTLEKEHRRVRRQLYEMGLREKYRESVLYLEGIPLAPTAIPESQEPVMLPEAKSLGKLLDAFADAVEERDALIAKWGPIYS